MELKQNNSILLSDVCYSIYKQCMFNPTYEKYLQKIQAILNDDAKFIYLCYIQSEIVGMIAISNITDKIEIVGIATKKDLKSQGIGSFMIKEVIKKENPISIYTETDSDAVSFYQKMWFFNLSIQKQIRKY